MPLIPRQPICVGLCKCRQDQNGETPATDVTATAAATAAAAAEKRDENRAEVRQIDIGKEAAMEAEVKAARERAIIPLEIRMKQFRDMLSEKEVRLQLKFSFVDVPV